MEDLAILDTLRDRTAGTYDQGATFEICRALAGAKTSTIWYALELVHANGMKEAAQRLKAKTEGVIEHADCLQFTYGGELARKLFRETPKEG